MLGVPEVGIFILQKIYHVHAITLPEKVGWTDVLEAIGWHFGSGVLSVGDFLEGQM